MCILSRKACCCSRKLTEHILTAHTGSRKVKVEDMEAASSQIPLSVLLPLASLCISEALMELKQTNYHTEEGNQGSPKECTEYDYTLSVNTDRLGAVKIATSSN